MAEITAVSTVQPSTVYQYFSNKDEIVWAILSDVMTESSDAAKEKVDVPAPAAEKIAALLEFMADELVHNPGRVRFMAQFDAMYARKWNPEKLVKLETEINPDGFAPLGSFIRQGISDGSLRKDLDPDLTMHAVMNAVIGAQRRLASLGRKVELEYGKTIEEMFRETIRVVMLGLSSPKPAVAQKTRKTKKNVGRANRSTSR